MFLGRLFRVSCKASYEEVINMIEFRSVQKSYGKQDITITDASFVIERGEFVILSGESGAGKSTLLKMIYKEELPSSGNLMIFGRDIKKIKTKHLRRDIGFVFQNFNLLTNKTVLENVAYVLECLGKSPIFVKRRAKECLEKMGVLHLANKYPQELSGGEQQRVVIARAIANEPKILICDEPTNNLDEKNTEIIVNHLLELNANETTIVLVTHDQEMIRNLNKRVLSVVDGKVSSIEAKNNTSKFDEFFDLSISQGKEV